MLPRKKFDKNGAIWCILSIPKLVIINLKINIFFINQQHKFCANFFSKINPDAHFDTQKYIHIKGGSGGAIPQKLKKCKNGGFTFFIPGAKIHPAMMWIQIHARGSGIFLSNGAIGAFLVFQNTL